MHYSLFILIKVYRINGKMKFLILVLKNYIDKLFYIKQARYKTDVVSTYSLFRLFLFNLTENAYRIHNNIIVIVVMHFYRPCHCRFYQMCAAFEFREATVLFLHHRPTQYTYVVRPKYVRLLRSTQSHRTMFIFIFHLSIFLSHVFNRTRN